MNQNDYNEAYEAGMAATRPLVKLPDGNYVNPAEVTLIEIVKRVDSQCRPITPNTLVWVRAHAGYGTTSLTFEGDRRDELAALINKG